MKKKITYFLFLGLLVASCSPSEKKETNIDFYSTDLFKDVQLHAIFPDSKSFADCTSKKDLAETVALYESQKSSSGFDLKKFVEDNFDLPIIPQSKFISDTTQSMQEHITSLWSVLQRDADKHNPNSSLIPLPNSYIVPGGRFAEIYYWDSYFTMLGLQAQGRYDIMKNMIDNFAFLIDSLGFIPNGNRNYYVGRSQPPFFAVMVSLLEEKDTVASSHYLPMFQKEYAFWMHGADQLKKPGDVVEHVVMMADGTVLNRYFDKIAQPRPEAYKEDYNLAQKSSGSKEELYTHLRAAAESGIDFSTRWFREGSGLESIHTTDFIAVDLNSLLFNLESAIAKGLLKKGDKAEADKMMMNAEKRKHAILQYCWNESEKFFYDYDFKAQKLSTVKALAASYPLFFKIATNEQAKGVASVLKKEFLKPGGLTTTLNNSGEQWDAPNGWAPLQWMSYQGLRNYHADDLAAEIKKRWLRVNERVYKSTGKMMEKYNVMDTTITGGGGEYPNQDGFGWTNGVALKLLLSN